MSNIEQARLQRLLEDKNAVVKLKRKLDGEKSLRLANCPQCKEDFVLCWNEGFDRSDSLEIRSCPSGGVYDVRITCPFCCYEEEL